MSAPTPPEGSGDGTVIRPDEARAFAGTLDELERGVADAHEALGRLAGEPLAVGSGADNAAIAAWYRELVASDTAPAARALAVELDAVRHAVRSSVAAWEQTDGQASSSLRLDPET